MSGSRLCLLLCCLATAATSRGADVLQWKLTPGDSLKYEVHSRTVTQSVIGGFESTTSLKQSMLMLWDVETVAADRSAVVNQMIERIRVELSPNGSETFTFDSLENIPPDNNIVRSLAAVFRKLVNQQFRVTMAATGNVTDVVIPEGLGEALRTAAAGNPSALDDKSLRQMMSQASVVLPVQPVAPGEQWQSEQTVDLGFATLQLKPEMTFREVNAEGQAVIEYVPNVSLVPNEGAAIRLTLQDADGSGIVLFDVERGRVVSMKLDLSMEMLSALNNRQTTQKIQQTTLMKLVE